MNYRVILGTAEINKERSIYVPLKEGKDLGTL